MSAVDPDRLGAALEDPRPGVDRVLAVIAGTATRPPTERDVVTALDDLATGAPLDADGLCAHVFGTHGFHGNPGDYYAPANSLIHRVIDRRTGNPLALACVTSEIGRRGGVPVEVLGMPGHVLLRIDGGLHDPFAGGRALSVDDAAAIFARLAPGRPFSTDLLAPMDRVAVAARTLANLRVAHLRTGHLAAVVDVVALSLALPGDHVAERRELAGVLTLLGRTEPAAELHEQLMELDPAHRDAHEAAVGRLRARRN